MPEKNFPTKSTIKSHGLYVWNELQHTKNIIHLKNTHLHNQSKLRKRTGSFIKLKGQKRKNVMKDLLAYLMIKQQIFGLDVSMNHIFLMTKRQRLREAQNVLKFTRDMHKDTKFDKKQWIKQEERTRKPVVTKHIK